MKLLREAHLKIETPAAMALRPVDHRGFPVPWFVTNKTEAGLWDFVNVERSRALGAMRFEKCWVSGQKLGRYKAFCIGPMCAISRTAGDPPTRKDIALWSVQVCPFMSRPRARRAARNEDQQIEGAGVDGVDIMRNPGVTGVWVTSNSEYQRGRGFYLGDPIEVTWWAEGRPATRDEVLASVDSGIHHLEKVARDEGEHAMEALALYRRRAEALWPAQPPEQHP